jgi:hypothetical protein
MWRRLARLSHGPIARIDAREISWRSAAIARTLRDRAWIAVRRPGWNRGQLRLALAPTTNLEDARAALAAERWDGAHQELSHVLANRPSRFLISPKHRTATADRIGGLFPEAASDATARAEELLGDRRDLLGYRGLQFGGDWHYDPVNGRRAPKQFWSTVAYLDPSCGDHKIIWEANRHQHWIALGRAYWLTLDRRYRDRFCAELAGWMDANPPLVGINWASMLELGFRSLSWLWALHFFVDAEAHDIAPWTVDLLLALDRQLTHIEQNLSYYFSPNTHLLGEALALYISGRALPELAASQRRERVGRRILVGEIQRQIAADGGHCERSTHYHRYTLDFYLWALAVARITDDPIALVFDEAVGSLASAGRLLVDDRGRVPHLGDDDGGMLFPIAGRAPDDWRDTLAIAAALVERPDLCVDRAPEEAYWIFAHPRLNGCVADNTEQGVPPDHRDHRHQSFHAGSRTITSARLPETGYCISRSGAGEHLIIDGGPHGYLNGGHAHADALSVTLTVRGLPLLIDPGTGCYTLNSTLRDRFRSTASHNTLVLDGRWQSVPCGPFHWSTRTDAIVHRWRSTGGFDYFDGSHHGYAPAEHRRRLLALHDDLLVVADLVIDSGHAEHAATVNWHIDPGWSIDLRDRSTVITAGNERVQLAVPAGRLVSHVASEDTGLGWWSPVYGRVEPATTLSVRHEGQAPFWIVSVFNLNPFDPVVDVEWLPVWAEAGVIAHATAVKVARQDSTDFVVLAEPAAQPAANPAAEPPASDNHQTWRLGELETDARMLFCRVARGGELKRLALVDGSLVRGAGRRALRLSLGRVVPALFIDESRIGMYSPCAASPGL